MANYLVIAEHRAGALKKVTFECLGEATRLAAKDSGTVSAIVVGKGVTGLADTLAQYGATTVYVADDASLADYNGQAYAATIAKVVTEKGFVAVFSGASATGKDLVPRLAAKLKVGIASDVTKIEYDNGRLLITRPVFAGKAYATVKLKGTPQVVTLRPNNFVALAADTGKKATVVTVATVDAGTGAKVTAFEGKTSEMPELTEASVIVSGGRGIKGPENYPLILELAKAVHGAAGASRAIVDAGWVEHQLQVGQTGKTVSPNLYIAVGISGAIQHLAGMSSSKVIVAINKDPEAPIFNVASYGIVGDLFDVIGPLTAEFKRVLAD